MQWYLDHLCFLYYTDLDDYIGPPLLPRYREFDRSSSMAMQLAKSWISACHERHTTCPKLFDSHLPDRVIEILSISSSGGDVQARLTCGTGVLDQYTALSYVWGGPQALVTTTKNIDSHFRFLPISSIATSIQDAIRVTHGLGLRYLWVDSLCIIQDSKSDKTQQISQMKTIFENSFVTIIAASSPTASSGFLRPPSDSRRSLRLPYWYENGDIGAVGLQERWAWDSRREVINSRAWTLEEKLLSPRQLIYSSNHMSWECRAETLYDPISGDRRREAYPLVLSKFWTIMSPKFTVLDDAKQDQEDLLTEWREVVTWYTARNMTDEADKLRAIAGLAESFEAAVKILWPNAADGRLYLAGIWMQDFPRGLLWFRRRLVELDSKSTRPTRYRAPSWSWAAINGEVIDFQSCKRKQFDGSYESMWYNREATVQSLGKILHADTALGTPFFPQSGAKIGALQLQGLLKRQDPCQLHLEPNAEFQGISHLLNKNGDPSDCNWFFSPDGTLEELQSLDAIWLLALLRQSLPVGYEPTSNGCIYSHPPKFDGNWVRVEGLLVYPVAENMYQRVGHFQCWHREFEQLMEGFKTVDLTLM